MSATTLTFDVSTTIALTIVITGVLKNFLEVWVRPDNRLHDPAIQLLALLIGIAWSWVFLWATGPVGRTAALQSVVSIILGLTGGAAGIGVYHVSTSVSPPAPAAAAPPPPAAADPGPRAPTAAPSAPAAAWSSTTVSYGPPAEPVGPSVSQAPPEPPQTPTEAPVGPTVTYTSGPPTP